MILDQQILISINNGFKCTQKENNLFWPINYLNWLKIISHLNFTTKVFKIYLNT